MRTRPAPALAHAERAVGGGQDRSALVQQGLAGGRQLHLPSAAQQQRAADLGLEPPDLRRQRGLRQVQTRGCAREVQFLRDGDEIAQLSELHECGNYRVPRIIVRIFLLRAAVAGEESMWA